VEEEKPQPVNLDDEEFRDRTHEGKLYQKSRVFTTNLNFALHKLMNQMESGQNLKQMFVAKQTAAAAKEPSSEEKKPSMLELLQIQMVQERKVHFKETDDETAQSMRKTSLINQTTIKTAVDNSSNNTLA